MCSHKNEYSSSYYRHKSRKPIVFIVIKTGQLMEISPKPFLTTNKKGFRKL